MQRLLPTMVCHVAVLCCASLCAQETVPPAAGETPKPAVAPGAPPVPSVEEAKLPVYLKSKDGRLVPMLDWTFEDFERVYQENEGLKQRDQTPLYSIQSMVASGEVKGNYAELTIQLGILLRDDQWVRIPLRLSQAILREGVKYDGPDGLCFLDFDADSEGYVGRMRGSAGQPRQLTLSAIVPIVQVGDECRLKLAVPRATTSSLKLTVPGKDLAGAVSTGATLSAASPNDQTTEFTVLGPSGDFELSWRSGANRPSEAEPVLEATGSILIRVDTATVHSEATLTVGAYGSPFDRFHVRLPEGAEVVPVNSKDYSVMPLPANEPNSKDRPLVEVRLARKSAGPIEVRLSTKRRYETSGASGWLELGGFDVVEAARQWGNIAIVAADDLQVICTAHRGLRQVDQLPESLQGDDRLAGFAYFSQPCSLTARVVPKKTRVSVEPEYVIDVGEDRLHLDGKLKYTVRAAKVAAVDVELGDWELDEVGPASLVNVDMVAVDQAGVLSVPLATPALGQVEITIRAHRRLAPGTKSLSLSLPRPQANSAGPAALVVLPADNVELIPDADATVGLVRQQVSPPMSLPRRQQTPLFYRGETAKAVFAAEMAVHPQSISVDVASEITLTADEKIVEQKLAYTIAYKPAETLTLEIPRALAGNSDLEVRCQGQLAPIAEVSDQAEPAGDTRPIKKRLLLPSPQIGPCELVVRYPVEHEELLPETSVVSTIPLVMPADGKLEGNKLCVLTSPGVKAQLREGPWTVVEDPGPSSERLRALQAAAEGRADKIVLGLHLEDRRALGTTVVERAWIQTWIAATPSGPQRQDRAVFRFTTDQNNLELFLPSGAEPAAVDLSIDRRRLQAKLSPSGSLLIPVPESSRVGPHVLEVYYHFPERMVELGRWPMQLPRLARQVWVRRVYWQLVLPQQQHLVTLPAGLTPEFTWGWTGAFWGRNPLVEQPQLEAWVGAAQLTAVPMATSRYLFSTMGPVEQCELRVASRSLIVLGASGLALVAGLLVIYVPLCRHPVVLLVVALLLFSFTFLAPEPMLLLSQAASLGLFLTLVAGLLQRSINQRRRRLLPSEKASSLLERGSTQTLYTAPAAGSGDATDITPPTASPSNPLP